MRRLDESAAPSQTRRRPGTKTPRKTQPLAAHSLSQDNRHGSGTLPQDLGQKVDAAVQKLLQGIQQAASNLPAGPTNAENTTSSQDVNQLGFKGASGTFGDRNWAPQLDPKAVAAARAALPADQQQKYDQLQQDESNNPATQAQLQNLLVQGTLTATDTRGKTLLDNLAKIDQGPATNGLDPKQVVADTVADITDPTTINQQQKGTCTATSMQSELAQRNPAEYSRLIAGLASGNGKVTLQDGKTKLDSHQYYGGSTTTEGLLSPALMDAEARHEGGHYDLKSDQIVSDDWYNIGGFENHGGAGGGDVAAVESELFGGKYHDQKVGGGFLGIDSGISHNDALNRLKAATPDNPVLVGISVPGGGHEVQVVGYDPGKNTVTIRNPWGEVDTIPADEFKNQLNDITTQG